jgi:hypothetical protein
MADFPPVTMSAKEDSRYRSETQADPAIRQEIEGGYVVTRPRYTRAPRKTFKTGFTDISQTDKAAFQTFYDSKKGGSESFTWADPVTATVYTVRFVGTPEIQYAGRGPSFRWNITNIGLEQV